MDQDGEFQGEETSISGFSFELPPGRRRTRGRTAPDRAKQLCDPGPNFPGPTLVDQLDSPVGLSQVALEGVGSPRSTLELIDQFSLASSSSWRRPTSPDRRRAVCRWWASISDSIS